MRILGLPTLEAFKKDHAASRGPLDAWQTDVERENWKTSHDESILFRMDQMQLSRKDLIPYIGSISKVSEVLSRKRPLSLPMIRRLNQGLGIPADILMEAVEIDSSVVDQEPDPSRLLHFGK